MSTFFAMVLADVNPGTHLTRPHSRSCSHRRARASRPPAPWSLREIDIPPRCSPTAVPCWSWVACCTSPWAIRKPSSRPRHSHRLSCTSSYAISVGADRRAARDHRRKQNLSVCFPEIFAARSNVGFGWSRSGATDVWRPESPFQIVNLTHACLAGSANRRSRPEGAGHEWQLSGVPIRHPSLEFLTEILLVEIGAEAEVDRNRLR